MNDEPSPGWEATIPPVARRAECSQLTELLAAIPLSATATTRDEGRGHDLEHFAADVGEHAADVAAAFRELRRRCPVLDDGGDEILAVESLNVGPQADAMILTAEDGETSWLASTDRNNIVSWLVVAETGEDKLTEADLPDFIRLTHLAFDALADG